MTVHVHQWKRWPVVDFSFDYQCAVCGEPESIVWVAAHAGKSVNDIDDLLVEKRGGVFAGEMMATPASPQKMPAPGVFTCPCCGAVSHHPMDAEQGYYGQCHWWTADPVLGPPHLEGLCSARAAR